MNKTKHRRVASEKLRAILTQIADDICRAQKTVSLALCGDTYRALAITAGAFLKNI